MHVRYQYLRQHERLQPDTEFSTRLAALLIHNMMIKYYIMQRTILIG